MNSHTGEERFDHSRLDPLRRQPSPVQEHVIDEFVRGGLSRRGFIRHATVAGIGMSSIGAVLSACGSPASPKASPSTSTGGRSGATIRAGMTTPGAAINPLSTSSTGGINTLQLCGEYLTLVDETFTVRPWLAESWTPNADGSAWTFKLRKGVKFNDGTPLTVDDVVYCFKQHSNPSVGSFALSVFGGVLTPGGVEKLDDTRIRFNLETPVADWPSFGVSQTNYSLVIVPKAFDFTKYEATFPGTGPFKMTNFRSNAGGTFVRNPHYWRNTTKPAQINVTYFASEQPQTTALVAGDIDCNDVFTALGSPQLLDGDFNLVALKSSAYMSAPMRCDTGPFANKLVRQAIALTLDRPQILKALWRDHAQLGNDHVFAPVFPSSPTSVPQRVRDIAKAKDLMAQAGVSRGFSFDLPTIDYSANLDFGQILKESASAIGIDVKLKTLSESAWWATGKFGSSQALDATMTFWGWSSRGVPNQLLGVLKTHDPKTGVGVYNAPRFDNSRYNTLADQFVQTVDLSRQQEIAGQIAELLLDETPELIPFWQEDLSAMQKNVHGLRKVPLGQLYGNMTKS